MSVNDTFLTGTATNRSNCQAPPHMLSYVSSVRLVRLLVRLFREKVIHREETGSPGQTNRSKFLIPVFNENRNRLPVESTGGRVV